MFSSAHWQTFVTMSIFVYNFIVFWPTFLIRNQSESMSLCSSEQILCQPLLFVTVPEISSDALCSVTIYIKV